MSDHFIDQSSFFGKMILDMCDTKFGVWLEKIKSEVQKERECDVNTRIKSYGILDAVFDGECE